VTIGYRIAINADGTIGDASARVGPASVDLPADTPPVLG
jgi:hypothetical protein